MTNIAIDAGGVALIVGVVQVLKGAGLPGKYAPVAALATGISYAIAFVEPGTHIAQVVVQGVMLGLAASGLYSGSKAMTEPKPEMPIIDQAPDDL